MPARVVKVQREEKLGFIERLYVPMIVKGLAVTSRQTDAVCPTTAHRGWL